MKNGIELIADERLEQIEKHNRTIKSDYDFNSNPTKYRDIYPIVIGVINMLDKDFVWTPDHWNEDVLNYMKSKPYKDRLIIAGALIAAEIDRLQYKEEKQINDFKKLGLDLIKVKPNITTI